MKTQKTLSLTVDKSVDKGKEISCLKVWLLLNKALLINNIYRT